MNLTTLTNLPNFPKLFQLLLIVIFHRNITIYDHYIIKKKEKGGAMGWFFWKKVMERQKHFFSAEKSIFSTLLGFPHFECLLGHEYL